METNHDLAAILMVRTISDYDMDRRVPVSADLIKLALGERAALFVSASGGRQFSTTLALQSRLSRLGGETEYRVDTVLTDVMNQTQFEQRALNL